MKLRNEYSYEYIHFHLQMSRSGLHCNHKLHLSYIFFQILYFAVPQTRIRRNHSLRHINSRGNYLSIPSTNLRMVFSSRNSRLDSNKQAIAATSNVTSRHRNEARVRLSYISRNVGWLTTSAMGAALCAATDSFNAFQRQMKRKTKREDRRDFNQRGGNRKYKDGNRGLRRTHIYRLGGGVQ